jgi:hypothetical protein
MANQPLNDNQPPPQQQAGDRRTDPKGKKSPGPSGAKQKGQNQQRRDSKH